MKPTPMPMAARGALATGRHPRAALAFAALAAALAATSGCSGGARAQDAVATTGHAPVGGPSGGGAYLAPTTTAASAGAPTVVAGGAAPSAKIRVVFKTIPPTKATVSWGKKHLGIIKPKAPLIIERPRDSGPLDVVIHAEGCLPVHSRAYTFTDTTLAVKVTPLDQKSTVYGYREAPPPDEMGPDGGTAVPPGARPDGGGLGLGSP